MKPPWLAYSLIPLLLLGCSQNINNQTEQVETVTIDTNTTNSVVIVPSKKDSVKPKPELAPSQHMYNLTIFDTTIVYNQLVNKILDTLYVGTTVPILKNDDQWSNPHYLKCQIQDSVIGWIPKHSVATVLFEDSLGSYLVKPGTMINGYEERPTCIKYFPNSDSKQFLEYNFSIINYIWPDYTKRISSTFSNTHEILYVFSSMESCPGSSKTEYIIRTNEGLKTLFNWWSSGFEEEGYEQGRIVDLDTSYTIVVPKMVNDTLRLCYFPDKENRFYEVEQDFQLECEFKNLLVLIKNVRKVKIGDDSYTKETEITEFYEWKDGGLKLFNRK